MRRTHGAPFKALLNHSYMHGVQHGSISPQSAVTLTFTKQALRHRGLKDLLVEDEPVDLYAYRT